MLFQPYHKLLYIHGSNTYMISPQKIHPSDDDACNDPTQWVDLYGDRLYKMALARVKDSSVAEDLVQETFLSGIKGLASFEGRTNLQSWLKSILQNKIIDYFRSAAYKSHDSERQESIDIQTLGFNSIGIWNTYVPNWAHDPEKILEDQQFIKALQHCISKLPPSHRQVFELRFIKELDQKDICKVSRISTSNYWVVLHRARMALRQCIEKSWVNK